MYTFSRVAAEKTRVSLLMLMLLLLQPGSRGLSSSMELTEFRERRLSLANASSLPFSSTSSWRDGMDIVEVFSRINVVVAAFFWNEGRVAFKLFFFWISKNSILVSTIYLPILNFERVQKAMASVPKKRLL